MDYRVISADDHIDLQWLPADTWQSRVSARLRDRAPMVVDTTAGKAWVCNGENWGPWSVPANDQGLTPSGRRLALTRAGVLEPGVLRPTTPKLRLADMDRDGVDASVMYGPLNMASLQDQELKTACVKAYNDWLAEFCANNPERLIGAGILPLDDPQGAAAELGRLADAGIRTAMLVPNRMKIPLWDRSWEPLWQAANDRRLPIGLHIGGGVRTANYSGSSSDSLGHRGVAVAAAPMQMDEPLAALIFSGAFERHPNLKIILAEAGFGWLPYFIERMNETYRNLADAKEQWQRHGGKDLPLLPEEYFGRQVWATFGVDPVGMRLLDVIGSDRIMWASDYPHSDSTWPNSRQVIDEQFFKVGPDVRRKLLCDNARALYDLN